MERIGFRVPEGFTAPDQNFYPELSAKEFIGRFQEQLASGEPIQLGYLKNVFISVERKDDTIVMVLLGTSIYCPPCDFDCKLSASEVVRWSGGLVE